MYFYFDVQGCRIEALMKEKIYDMVLKDKINPKKLYTFGNVKLLNNVGLNRMSDHDYILQLTKKIDIREAESNIYTSFGLIYMSTSMKFPI